MKIRIVDCRCPICGSDNTRSKVAGEDGKWWFICDNQECPEQIVADGQLVKFEGRFYFPKEGDYKAMFIEGNHALYKRKSVNKWAKVHTYKVG